MASFRARSVGGERIRHRSGLPGAILCKQPCRVKLLARAEFAKDKSTQATGYKGWGPSAAYDYPPSFNSSRAPPPPPPPPAPEDRNGKDSFTKALIAAAFVTGLGVGVYFDSEIALQPANVASTELIDRRTPNSELCMAYGYSAMVFDQRLFVSFNPFNVYVTQPEVKPGCILRRSNVAVLENRKLVNDQQVDACKRNMNTFAFVGELDDSPQVSCVYHSEEAENQYLINPKRLVPSQELPAAPPVRP